MAEEEIPLPLLCKRPILNYLFAVGVTWAGVVDKVVVAGADCEKRLSRKCCRRRCVECGSRERDFRLGFCRNNFRLLRIAILSLLSLSPSRSFFLSFFFFFFKKKKKVPLGF